MAINSRCYHGVAHDAWLPFAAVAPVVGCGLRADGLRTCSFCYICSASCIAVVLFPVELCADNSPWVVSVIVVHHIMPLAAGLWLRAVAGDNLTLEVPRG